MAVYYKFKSAKDYDSVPMDGHFISVGQLKEKIFELKHLGGTDFDLIVTNAQTNEEYLDEGMLIPKNTSVLIRRVPGRPRKPIVTAPVSEQEELNVDHNSEDVQAIKGSFAVADQSYGKYADDLEWDEFGNDLYAMPETTPVPSSIPVQDVTPVSKEDEESKIKALIDTPALDWQRQPSDGFNPGRGFMRGGRMQGGRGGFAARGGFEKKTPPQGYICHRCKVSGHFIQHCPTNGDPNFDIRRVKPPTGIPKSMLIATPDGSYALASGAPASLKPNEAAFEKEIEGMPSTRSIGELPRELRCPLCQEVMKDAVLASKCCLKSFCDKCIRDHIISKSMCECGATSILADDLLPNKTVRDTINRILESSNNSAENGGSAFQAQDMESRIPQAKVTSPTQSAASKGQQQVPASPLRQQEIPKIVETIEENKPADVPLKSEKGLALKVPDASEATHDSRMVKEAASQGSAPLADEEVQQKPMSGEAGRKKKKKKIRMAPNPAEMQWRTGPDLAPENYMMNNPGWNNQGPSAFNPGWNGMQPGFDGFMPYGAGHMPYGGYGVNPMDVQFGGFLPYGVSHMDVPFAGPPPGGILSYGPQRDLSELVGYNAPPPIMSREEFEARKADLKRKREMERRDDSCRELPKDREYGREGSSTVNVSSRSKSRLTPPPSGADHHLPSRHHHTPERRSRDPELPRPSSKKKPDFDHEDHHLRRREYHEETHRDHHHRSSSSSHHRRSESPTEPPPASSQACSAAEKKHKASVFSRISFPAGGESSTKKRKVSSSDAPVAGSTSHRASNGQHEEHKATSGSRKGASAATVGVTIDQDSSDDERHFKRRPSRYTSSPPAAAPAEEENRHSRGSKDRERERYSSKRR